MRNYFFSVTIHVILLLLLLGLTSVTVKKEKEIEYQAIMVDFSQEEQPQPRKATPELDSPQKKEEPVKPVQPKAAPEPVAKKVRTFEKKTLQTSQKPQEQKSQVLEEESPVVKKIVPPSPPAPTPEEIEAAEKEKERARKRAQFDALLSKAKKKTATDQNQSEKMEESTGSNTGASTESESSNKNIRGVLGKRKVLKVPEIKDDSQKKGRVVVKICVNAAGKVTSSKYTMMGSTTSDLYLINLAEEGAKDYLFSPSKNPKECGNVIIEFKLK